MLDQIQRLNSSMQHQTLDPCHRVRLTKSLLCAPAASTSGNKELTPNNTVVAPHKQLCT